MRRLELPDLRHEVHRNDHSLRLHQRSCPRRLLVHGGFADASSWADVIPEVQSDGLQVLAAANPLRGVASDGTYIANVAS